MVWLIRWLMGSWKWIMCTIRPCIRLTALAKCWENSGCVVPVSVVMKACPKAKKVIKTAQYLWSLCFAMFTLQQPWIHLIISFSWCSVQLRSFRFSSTLLLSSWWTVKMYCREIARWKMAQLSPSLSVIVGAHKPLASFSVFAQWLNALYARQRHLHNASRVESLLFLPYISSLPGLDV